MFQITRSLRYFSRNSSSLLNKSIYFSSSRSFGTLVDFKLADIGEGIAECELIQWFVNEGDVVSQFDKICEVQSDKATVEITSRFDGEIKKLYYKQGDMASVGTPLVQIDAEGDVEQVSVDSIKEEDNEKVAEEDTSSSSTNEHIISPSTGRVLCSPAVRHIAKTNNIDLNTINGSGPKGRITKGDIMQYMSNSASSSTTTSTITQTSPPINISQQVSIPQAVSTNSTTPSVTQPYVNRFTYTGQDEVHKISGIERIMVKTMQNALKVPLFGYKDDINVGKLNELRKSLKVSASTYGINLSNLPLIIKASSLALLHFPQLNAHVNDDCTEIIHKSSHNIGIAVDTPRGLLVPNIKDCQNKSVLEIALEIKRLAELGREGKLGSNDLTGGTFTISNIGSIGGTYAAPVVVVPEVIIGAIGKFQTLPRYNENNELVPQDIMNVSWSADHRVIDGATVARFSNLLKSYLEDPALMLLHVK